MTNQKISARTLATPPLVGDEKIPIGVTGDKAITPDMLKDYIANGIVTIVPKTDNYPFVLSDFDGLPKLFTFSKATALSVTIPTNTAQAVAIGKSIWIQRTGVGILTVSPVDVTVTITGSSGALTDAGLNVIMVLTKTGTNTWDLQNGSPNTWQTWVPTYTGFSANPVVSAARYSLIGKTCTVHLHSAAGTSNATTLTVTLPFAAANTATFQAPVLVVDNGFVVLGRIITTVNSNVLNVYATAGAGPFTGSGGKAVYLAGFTYEIA